jgi:hypothetical protein
LEGREGVENELLDGMWGIFNEFRKGWGCGCLQWKFFMCGRRRVTGDGGLVVCDVGSGAWLQRLSGSRDFDMTRPLPHL